MVESRDKLTPQLAVNSTLSIGEPNKVNDSLSTHHQWQKAFSKGDQVLDMKRKQVPLEEDFMHQTEQVEFKLDAIEVVIHKI